MCRVCGLDINRCECRYTTSKGNVFKLLSFKPSKVIDTSSTIDANDEKKTNVNSDTLPTNSSSNNECDNKRDHNDNKVKTNNKSKPVPLLNTSIIQRSSQPEINTMASVDTTENDYYKHKLNLLNQKLLGLETQQKQSDRAIVLIGVVGFVGMITLATITGFYMGKCIEHQQQQQQQHQHQQLNMYTKPSILSQQSTLL